MVNGTLYILNSDDYQGSNKTITSDLTTIF